MADRHAVSQPLPRKEVSAARHVIVTGPPPRADDAESIWRAEAASGVARASPTGATDMGIGKLGKRLDKIARKAKKTLGRRGKEVAEAVLERAISILDSELKAADAAKSA